MIVPFLGAFLFSPKLVQKTTKPDNLIQFVLTKTALHAQNLRPSDRKRPIPGRCVNR